MGLLEPRYISKQTSRTETLHFQREWFCYTHPSLLKDGPLCCRCQYFPIRKPLLPTMSCYSTKTPICTLPTLSSGSRFFTHLGAFSKQYFIDRVREYLLRAGISSQGYSGHSLRKGAAVTATAKGMSKDEIKLLGRWKSNAVDIYINDVGPVAHDTKLLSLNTRFCAPASSLSSLAPTNALPLSYPSPAPPSSPSIRRLARRDLQRSLRDGGLAP